MKYLTVEHPLILRYDGEGEGHWHASRDGGARLHEGEDILFEPETVIKAWALMKVVKHGYCYDDDARWRYVHVATEDCEWRLLYTTLHSSLKVGDWIPTGTPLCIVQDISRRYPGARPHVHFTKYVGGKKVKPEIGE